MNDEYLSCMYHVLGQLNPRERYLLRSMQLYGADKVGEFSMCKEIGRFGTPCNNCMVSSYDAEPKAPYCSDESDDDSINRHPTCAVAWADCFVQVATMFSESTLQREVLWDTGASLCVSSAKEDFIGTIHPVAAVN